MSNTLSLRTPRVLPDLVADQAAELAQLRAELEALRASQSSKLTLKVSEKGALCLYGLGRFPVTLYRSQWERILDATPAIRAFIAANASSLTTKG